MFDDVVREHHSLAGMKRAVSENVVVRAIRSQRSDAANAVEDVFASCHRRPERESHAFQHVRHEDSRGHLDRHPKGFKRRPEAARRHSSIKTGHDAHCRIEQRRDDLLHAIRFHAHIAVRNNEVRTRGCGNHLFHGEDFCVRIFGFAR